MGRTQATERTGKTWKLLKMIGIATMLLAIGMIFAAMNQTSSNKNAGMVAGGFLLFFFAGLPVYLFGRMGAWWFHA